MKKINWIIEKDLYPEYENELIKFIKESRNIAYHYENNFNDDFKKLINKFKEDDIVITYGSIQLNRKILRESLYPGTFLTLNNYECYNYYGYFGYNLLNSDYVMLGLNDVLRCKNRLYPDYKNLFIRPSNGYKSFTGQCLNKDNFDEEFNMLCKSYGGLDMNTLVLISPVLVIDEEWRFVVIDGKVISGALYMDLNNRKDWKAYYDKPCKDENAYNFAEKMVKLYQPDKAYTIDICKTPNGQYKVIEINSLCSASLYGNDYEKIVNEMNKIVMSEWKDIFEI